MVKVSIIIPVYNSSKYLSRCIDSVLNQTLDNIEIIVVNDGSTDESESIIKSYDDNRIKYYKRRKCGIGSSRNYGIEMSRGKYICFLDSDDYLNNTFCEEMYNKCIKEKLDVCVCDYYSYLENEQSIKKYELSSFEITNLENNPKLLIDINLSSCNKMFRKKLFTDNKIKFPNKLKYEDITFVTKTLRLAKRIGKVDIPLYYFQEHDECVIKKTDEKMFDIFKILDMVYNDLKGYSKLRKYLSYLIVDEVTTYISMQKYQKNRKIKNEFINYGYKYMNDHIKNYKKSSYFRDINPVKALVQKNKLLTKLYCNI